MTNEETNLILKDILEQLKKDSLTDQLLGDIVRILEENQKIAQSVEIQNTQRFMDMKNILDDIKENQQSPFTFKIKPKEDSDMK